MIETESQAGGFSPGSADRVVLADGRRAFVKAVSAGLNSDSLEMHRTEAVVAGALPAGMPTPTFLGAVDTGSWVALCFEDVDGRHPVTPWGRAEIDAVLATLAAVSVKPIDPTAIPNPPVAQHLAADFAGWERIVADPPSLLPVLVADHLDELRTLAASAPQACRGNALCHLDIRADNLLIDAGGRVWIVDWPWAATGAPWIDALMLLVNVGLYGGHDLQDLVAASSVLRATDPVSINAFLAGIAAFFVDAGRSPDPPGLPTLRLFQRQQGDVVLRWLAQRLGW